MTTLVVDVPGERVVQGLYGRYKGLALAAGATLLLDAPLGSLEAEVDGLVADACAAASAGGPHAAQFEACVAAAGELRELLVRRGGDVEAVRATHRRLRREVWKIVPCEYVPCCASGHGRERTGGRHG